MTLKKSDSARRVSALRDLPQAIEPPAALWSRIEAELAPRRPALRRPWLAGARLRVLAAAAVLAALAAGIVIGRLLLPAAGPQGPPLTAHHERVLQAVPVAYVSDPRYLKEREALLSSLQSQLEALPPASRSKVIASLATIHQSMRQLEAALGRDPSSALLQELLVDTYQDEMRVLTTVHEAAQAEEGI